ncbi:MAG TPA: TonB-dependent receptor [Puia sp.]|nr:TonB-dependent receptor [Puia sp.]
MKKKTTAGILLPRLTGLFLFGCFTILFHSSGYSQDSRDTIPMRPAKDSSAPRPGKDTASPRPAKDTASPRPARDTVPLHPAKDTVGNSKDTVRIGNSKDTLRASRRQDSTASAENPGDSSSVILSGRVTLGAGATDLSGTSVQIKGSKKFVPTDSSGHYRISVPKNAVLVFSHVGFRPAESTVTGQSTLNITLQTAGENLSQVVVVSYGKQRQRDIIGSIAKVDAGPLQDIPATEFGQKLQGKVAGLQASQVTGNPGQAMFFRIRSAASLNSGNQPLIVVDGLPISGDVVNLINPEDIESYSVLKDAAASSLYGSRSANGVILITTRQARAGKTSVTANAYYGLQEVPKRGRPDLMNARQFATFMNGYYQDKILYENWINPTTGTATIPSDYTHPELYGHGTDWYDAVIRSAPIQAYSVNLSAGNNKILSSNTFSYFDQQGVLVNTGVRRYSFRSNNEYRPVDPVKIGLNISPSYQIDHNTHAALDGNRQLASGEELSSPLISPYNPDGSFVLKTSSYGMYALPNFLQQAKLSNVNQNNLNLLTNAYIDIEIIKGLHAKSSINADVITEDYSAYYGTQYGTFGAPPPRSPASSSAVSNSNNSISWLNENTVDYATKLGDHNIDVLAGYSAQRYRQDIHTVNGTGFANDAVPLISGATTTTGTTDKQEWSIASAFARINYDFKGRYYVSGTVRRDGSSRFGENKKYGTFPSVAVGWVASDESFFPKSDLVSFLKFRGSYGLTGNFNVGNYTYVPLLSPTNYVFNGTTNLGESITSLGNPNLTWETSKQTDVGAEMNLFKNRVLLSYDYYNKRTEGMLSTLQIPYASGYSTISYNLGVLRMWGHEIQVSSRNLIGKFTWNTDFNISFNKNVVVSLVNNTPIGGTAKYSDYHRTAVGHPIGMFYGYIFDGIYMNQAEFDKYPHEETSAVGTARMRDVNGDGKIDISDRTFIGDPSPKFIFGMTNNFTFQNFDLNIIVAGQAGNKIMNTNLQNLQNLDGIFNVEKGMINRWRSEEDPGNGKVPRTLANTTELYRTVNTNWVFSGDYIAVKNIALGYTIPKKTLRYIKSIRVYASVQNAFMFTKYPGQNPEVNDTHDSQTTAGTDNGSFPIPRTMMLGANINF